MSDWLNLLLSFFGRGPLPHNVKRMKKPKKKPEPVTYDPKLFRRPRW